MSACKRRRTAKDNQTVRIMDVLKDTLRQMIIAKNPRLTFTELHGKSNALEKFERVLLDTYQTDYAICKACKRLVKFTSDGGTSGLIRHSCAGNASSPSSSKPVASNVSHQPQIACFSKKILPSHVKSDTTDIVCSMCAMDLLPFNIVDGAGFKKLAQHFIDLGAKYGKIDVEDILPAPRTISRHVCNIYEDTKTKISNELKACSDFSITTDLWTEIRTNTHCVTVTIHYIHNWQLISRVLATREMAEAKTYQSIRSTVEAILQDFGVYREDNTFVTDNGKNVVAAFQNYTLLTCAGHSLSVVLENVFDQLEDENPEMLTVKNLLREAKALVTHIKRSGLQKCLDKSLKQEIETRWNTKLHMIKSIQEALHSGKLQEILSTRNELHYILNIDERLLGDLIQLLEPFDEATRHLSAEHKPTIHLVLPTKVTLLKALKEQPDDSEVICQLKEMLVKNLEEKFPIHIIHKMATCLNPVMKAFVKKTLSSEEYEEVIGSLSNMVDIDSEALNRDDHVPVKQKKRRCEEVQELDVFFASCLEDDSEDEVKSSRQWVQEYLDSKVDVHQGHLLNFWKESTSPLATVAKKLLAIPATSSPSERSFCSAGCLIEQRRAALSTDNVDALLFLHSNLHRPRRVQE